MMNTLSLIQQILIYAIPILFAITVHEVAHGWVASKFGDQTAKLMGRLTLNPIKHIDPMGTVILPVILLMLHAPIFGWAKPVPVDWRNLRNPKRDMAWVAAAGPGANLLMLILWALLAKLAVLIGEPATGLWGALGQMAFAGIMINSVLMILNLFPVPPLDGSRVLTALLPPVLAHKYNQLERYGLLIIMVLLMTGYLGRILEPIITGFLSLVSLIFGL